MRTLHLVAVNLLLTALLLLAVEGCVRLTHPEIGPIGTDGPISAPNRYGSSPGLRPSAWGTTDGAPFLIDSSGFWDYKGARHAPTSASGLPAWLFLGDSVTMGLGVDPDSTFAGRVAAALDTAVVLNPSLFGYQAPDYVAVLDALLDRPGLAIRRVTVFWCLNDAYPLQAWRGTAAPTVRASNSQLMAFIRRYVRTFQWAKATFADRPLDYFRYDRQFYDSDSAFAAATESLAALRARAADHGVPLDIVVLPYEAQLRAKALPDAWAPQRQVQQATTVLNLPFLDAARAFDDTADPSSLYRYGDGIHFSARGHALLAHYFLTHL